MNTANENIKLKNISTSTNKRKNPITNYFEFTASASNVNNKHTSQTKSAKVKPKYRKHSGTDDKPSVIDLTNLESSKNFKRQISTLKSKNKMVDENLPSSTNRNIWSAVKSWENIDNEKKLATNRSNTKHAKYTNKNSSQGIKRKGLFSSLNSSKKIKTDNIEPQVVTPPLSYNSSDNESMQVDTGSLNLVNGDRENNDTFNDKIYGLDNVTAKKVVGKNNMEKKLNDNIMKTKSVTKELHSSGYSQLVSPASMSMNIKRMHDIDIIQESKKVEESTSLPTKHLAGLTEKAKINNSLTLQTNLTLQTEKEHSEINNEGTNNINGNESIDNSPKSWKSLERNSSHASPVEELDIYDLFTDNTNIKRSTSNSSFSSDDELNNLPVFQAQESDNNTSTSVEKSGMFNGFKPLKTTETPSNKKHEVSLLKKDPLILSSGVSPLTNGTSDHDNLHLNDMDMANFDTHIEARNQDSSHFNNVFSDIDNSSSQENLYDGKDSDFSNNNCEKDNFLVKNNLYASPLKSSQDSLNWSQDLNCSPRVVLQKLNLLKGECPLTPRSTKFRKLNFKDSEIYFDTSQLSPKQSNEKEQKPKKIKFTLKRMIQDKAKSDKVKSMEVELLSDIHKGGVARHFDDEDQEKEDNLSDPGSPEDAGKLAMMERMVDTSEYCQGLSTTLPNLHLFSRAQVFCQFCPHTITNSLPEKQKGLDLDSMLHHLRMKNFQPDTIGCKNNEELVVFLIKLMSCYYDYEIVNSIERILLTLIKSATFTCNEKQSALYNETFNQVFLNVGVKMSDKKCSPKLNNNNCRICKRKNVSLQMISRTLSSIIKIFASLVEYNIPCFTDIDLPIFIVLFSQLLTSKTILYNIQHSLNEAILALLDQVVDWPTVRLSSTKTLLEKVTDFQICEHICSLLPSSSVRSQQFKRSISQFVLEIILKNKDPSLIVPNGIDTADFEPLQNLSNQIKLKSQSNTDTNRKLFIIFWVCFLMLQHSVGNEHVLPKNRKFLEGILENVWFCYSTIRDDRRLYCFEFKNYLRIIHDKLTSQLRQLPKPKSTGIFKYLCESKVNANYVSESQSPDHEDSFISEDLDLMSITT